VVLQMRVIVQEMMRKMGNLILVVTLIVRRVGKGRK